MNRVYGSTITDMREAEAVKSPNHSNANRTPTFSYSLGLVVSCLVREYRVTE